MPHPIPLPVAAIIAGGQSARLGGEDKALVEIGGRPQLARLLQALAPQVSGAFLVSNRPPHTYAAFGLPVVADRWPGQPGPLAGIEAALQHAGQGDVLCVPVDAVSLPSDLVDRLQQARSQAGSSTACVHDGNGLQPVCCLLPAALAASAQRALESGERALHRWLSAGGVAVADFSHWPHWAWSFNTAQELGAARTRLQ